MDKLLFWLGLGAGQKGARSKEVKPSRHPVIISSHKTTVAMMNSIHSLLSENHPCTSFMASLLSATHAPS